MEAKDKHPLTSAIGIKCWGQTTGAFAGRRMGCLMSCVCVHQAGIGARVKGGNERIKLHTLGLGTSGRG